MAFRITGLDPEPFRPLWGASDAVLARAGGLRMRADAAPGYPDRITLEDAPLGAPVLLLSHVSQPAPTPYRARHAIFVLEGAVARYDRVDEVPPVMRRRPLSLRAFDPDGMMRNADLAEGEDAVAALIERLFGDPEVAEIHAHNARQGCFAGRITRA